MSHKVREIYKLLILLILVEAPMLNLSAQEQGSTGDLRDTVMHTLQSYADLANSIKSGTQPDPARPFIALFRNVRVPVYNDLSVDNGFEQIPLIDYVNYLKQNFPGGLNYSINLDQIRIKKLKREDEDLQLVEVRLKRKIEGRKDNADFIRSDKLIILLGLDISDGDYQNCRIYDISPQVIHRQDLLIFSNPAYNRIFSQQFNEDVRFNLPWDFSWEAGIEYRYFIKDSWGFGSGIKTGKYNHLLDLDRLDPLNGHNPNMTDVRWKGELNYIGMPLYMFYQFGFNRNLEINIRGGMDFGYRVFESITTSAKNRHYDVVMDGIVSDPFRYDNISDINVAMELQMAIEYRINRKLAIMLGVGIKQGINDLRKDILAELPYTVYQGQYDPLFYGSSSSSYSQMVFTRIGMIYNLSEKGGFADQ